MILLKKIKLNNFLSYENETISFEKSEKVLIDGASGAGKSSILEAILWCLYGQGRTNNRALIKKKSRKTSVCLKIEEDKDTNKSSIITINRSSTIDSKNTLKISVEDNKTLQKKFISKGVGLKGNQEWIEKKVIGASWLLFINSIAYVQNNKDSFVLQTAQKKKKLLLEIAKAENYKIYHDKAHQALLKLNNEIDMFDGKIASLENIVESFSDIDKRKKAIMLDSLISSKKIEDLSPVIQELKKQKEAFSSVIKSIEIMKEKLKMFISNKIFIKNDLIERKQEIAEEKDLIKIIKENTNIEEKIKKEKKTLSNIQSFLAEAIKNEIQKNLVLSKKPYIIDRNPEILRLTSLLTKVEREPVCPSGEKCPYYSSHIMQSKKIKAQLKQIDSLMDKDKQNLDNWKIRMKTIPASVNIDELKEKETRQKSILEELENKKIEIENAKNKLKNITKIKLKISELENLLKEKENDILKIEDKKKKLEEKTNIEKMTKVDNLLRYNENEIKISKNELIKSNTLLDSIKKEEKTVKGLNQKIDILKRKTSVIRKKIKKITLVKKAFGSIGGIETLVIDYLLPRLEEKINKILSKLSDFRVRLDTQKKNITSDTKSEGLFITIINEKNEELPYESYSGGEKVKITFAISEAFASLIRKNIGFRLIDEEILALDKNSLESFMNTVEELFSGFNQVLFISHIQEIKDLFDKKILVKKDNNSSFIVK